MPINTNNQSGCIFIKTENGQLIPFSGVIKEVGIDYGRDEGDTAVYANLSHICEPLSFRATLTHKSARSVRKYFRWVMNKKRRIIRDLKRRKEKIRRYKLKGKPYHEIY